MAKSGSIDWAVRKAVLAGSYSKLCRYKTPRMKSSCAALVPEFGKRTVPKVAVCADEISTQHIASKGKTKANAHLARGLCITESRLVGVLSLHSCFGLSDFLLKARHVRLLHYSCQCENQLTLCHPIQITEKRGSSGWQDRRPTPGVNSCTRRRQRSRVCAS